MMWMIASVPLWASGLFCVRGAIRSLQAPCLRFPAACMVIGAGIFFAIAAWVAT